MTSPPEVLSGYLLKKGEHLNAAYKRRFFKVETLNQSWVLNYYDESFKSKGFIKISEIQKLFWTREPDWGIEVHTPKRTYFLKLEFKENAQPGENLQELQKWIIGLNSWGKFTNPKFELCDPPEQKDIEKMQQTKGVVSPKSPRRPQKPPVAEKKGMKGEEKEAMKGEEKKAMKGEEKEAMKGEEKKAMKGEEKEAMKGEEKEKPKADDEKKKVMFSEEPKSPTKEKAPEASSVPMKKDWGIPIRQKKTQVQEANPVRIRCYVPEWEAEALLPSGDFTVIKSTDFKNRYLLVFFYPQDFTSVCPTELLAFSSSASHFLNNDCDIVAVSVDTKYSHAAWKNIPRSEGGISGINIPLIADNTKQLARIFGVYLPEQGITLRGSFIIDTKNILRSSIINDTQVGRSVSETLRLIEAFQFSDEHGEVCPANWKKGDDTIDENNKKKFFQKTYGTKSLLTDKVYKNEKMKGMEEFM